ncbi:MAG: hypothetical protein HC853_06375, partial [Anaerolineae bacterium]|nr:hypothetical protein [Anaerolineae bacterium]
MASVTDAMGNVTRIAYDVLNRKIAMSDPDMGDWQYAYDRAGNLVWQGDAKGQAQRFVYDPLGRLALKHSLPASWRDPFETLTPTWSVRGSVQAQGGTLTIVANGKALNARPIVPGSGVR